MRSPAGTGSPRGAAHPPHRTDRAGREAIPRNGERTRREDVNLPFRGFGSYPFTPERFHVLLNSLFKVLFNFPSRYLFSIGLVVVFSLRWSLPPA